VIDFTDPLAVFRAAVAALNAEDWRGAAALVDPVSLRDFVNNVRERLAPDRGPRAVTAEEYLASDPQLPRAVAEHYAAQSRRQTDPQWQLPRELPGVESVDALRALAADEVFARWLEGRSGRRQIERLAADGRISQAIAARQSASKSPVRPSGNRVAVWVDAEESGEGVDAAEVVCGRLST
jgi:hypothetical protein